MARDRSRGRVPNVTGGGGTDEEEPDEEEPDEEERERADRGGGTVEDLRNSGRERVRSETAPGSQADLAIDPSINPGFVDTEVVNRVGLVLSLQCVYNPETGYWQPLTTKDLSSSSYSSGLLADTITEALGNVLGSQNRIDADEDGNLRLGDGLANQTTTGSGAGTTKNTTTERGYVFRQDGTEEPHYVVVSETDPPIDTMTLRGAGMDYNPRSYDVSPGVVKVPHDWVTTNDGFVAFGAGGQTYQEVKYSFSNYPIDVAGGRITNGYFEGGFDSAAIWNVEAVGSGPPSDTGTATTAFGSPERATRYDKALYNATPNGGSYRVDLYSGDPSSPSGELLARDISPREDISDIPPSKGPLQLKIHMQSSDQGDSPRLTKAGIQYEQ